MIDHSSVFDAAHRGPYRAEQRCVVICNPSFPSLVGQVLTTASTAAWYVQTSTSGPVRWDRIYWRYAGLEVQHIYARGRGIATYPVRWMVPIDRDPDAVDESEDQDREIGSTTAAR